MDWNEIARRTGVTESEVVRLHDRACVHMNILLAAMEVGAGPDETKRALFAALREVDELTETQDRFGTLWATGVEHGYQLAGQGPAGRARSRGDVPRQRLPRRAARAAVPGGQGIGGPCWDWALGGRSEASGAA